MINIRYLVILLTSCFSATNTFPQNSENTSPKKVNYSAALGLAMAPQYEGSSDILVLPVLSFSADWISGQYIRLSNAGLEFNSLNRKKWEFGPKLSFKTPRDDYFVDNQQVRMLDELDFAISAGAFARYRSGKIDLKLEFIQDISKVSDGGLGRLDLGYTLNHKNRLITRFSVNSSFATENYMDTYFGINSENRGTSTLSNYDLDSGIKDVGASILSSYIINQKWIITGQLAYNMLLGDVADSPVVELGSESQIVGTLLAIYRF